MPSDVLSLACPTFLLVRGGAGVGGWAGVQGSGEGLPRAACLYGGMSGMFGIWVFTSQDAHGSLVLKSVSFMQGEGPSGPGQSWI